jgi:hypothetical protein
MDCIWIWNIYNCEQSKILLNIVIIGIIYMILLIILLFYTFIKLYIKKKELNIFFN